MKKYEYEHLAIDNFMGWNLQGHRQIIDDYAARGYRFVGAIPTNSDRRGVLYGVDLVFEKDIDIKTDISRDIDKEA